MNATRRDITFCTQQLSQILYALTTTHFNVTCRVLKYLKTFLSWGILFPRDSSIQLNGYSDADWGGCVETQKSISS